MVLDAAGSVHAVATASQYVYYISNSPYYISDSPGNWIFARLSDPPRRGVTKNPSIAIDTDGSMYVVWSYYFDCVDGCGHEESQGLSMQMWRDQEWSGIRRIGAPNDELSSLAVRDGVLHLATVRWNDPVGWAPYYSTWDDGEWHEQKLADKGEDPQIALDASGRPHIIFHDDQRLFYVHPSGDGSPTIEAGPNAGYSLFALDAAETPHVVGHAGELPYYRTRSVDGKWSDGVFTELHSYATAVAVTGNGKVFVLTGGDANGVWYSTGTDAAFQAIELYDVPGSTTFTTPSAVALDTAGRPHVLFTDPRFDSSDAGLWYAVGPPPSDW